MEPKDTFISTETLIFRFFKTQRRLICQNLRKVYIFIPRPPEGVVATPSAFCNKIAKRLHVIYTNPITRCSTNIHRNLGVSYG